MKLYYNISVWIAFVLITIFAGFSLYRGTNFPNMSKEMVYLTNPEYETIYYLHASVQEGLKYRITRPKEIKHKNNYIFVQTKLVFYGSKDAFKNTSHHITCVYLESDSVAKHIFPITGCEAEPRLSFGNDPQTQAKIIIARSRVVNKLRGSPFIVE